MILIISQVVPGHHSPRGDIEVKTICYACAVFWVHVAIYSRYVQDWVLLHRSKTCGDTLCDVAIGLYI